MRGKPPKHLDRKMDAFLAELEVTANVTASCAKVGISLRTIYAWRQRDEKFAAAWDKAVERGTDALEDEAVRRAFEGVDETVYYQGQPCGTVRRYSDTLLIFMLKARRPEKFKERTATELSGAIAITHEQWLEKLA